ncbi:hypothetical protein F6X53_16655 [Methylobacterium soli]|uniref:Uncharacterized protein n=1 Tax=Methylobacterium soli TaxID=553447 RepID=A0A6L3SVR2_9HYPH|nr:hypothetical protein F6X53_16655 [Methylobacterium soli]
MSFRNSAALLAFVTAIGVPAAALAWGIPGCPNLPEYHRALGTLQGLTTCGMSVDEARRIVAAHDGPAAAAQQVAPPQAQIRRSRKPQRHGAALSRRRAAHSRH